MAALISASVSPLASDTALPVPSSFAGFCIVTIKSTVTTPSDPEFSPFTERCPLSRIATCAGDALNPASRNARCTSPQIRPLLLPNTTDMYRPGFSTRNASEKAPRSSAS